MIKKMGQLKLQLDNILLFSRDFYSTFSGVFYEPLLAGTDLFSLLFEWKFLENMRMELFGRTLINSSLHLVWHPLWTIAMMFFPNLYPFWLLSYDLYLHQYDCDSFEMICQSKMKNFHIWGSLVQDIFSYL